MVSQAATPIGMKILARARVKTTNSSMIKNLRIFCRAPGALLFCRLGPDLRSRRTRCRLSWRLLTKDTPADREDPAAGALRPGREPR